jgi:threonine dehydratase
VIGVEPVVADGMTRALEAGHPVAIGHPPTVADGLAAPFAGEHTLRHVRRFVDTVLRVDEAAIVEALRLVITRCKLAAEPSGAAPLAALLTRPAELAGVKRVVCVVSGGNVDPAALGRLLEG